jgi:DNA relaxase NicK
MALEWFFGELERVFGLPMTKPRPGGWMGYKQSAWLGDYGLVAWGGIHQRGTLHAEINGQGCAQVKDWIGVAAWGNALGATITRIDLAHDDYEGRLCNPGQIEAWYDTGGFNSGGCPPKLRHDGDYTECTDGQTLYIGTRGNKLLRCYEKGKQLKFPTSPWFRVELELKNKNRIIPWEAVELPGQYLAGAYPCLAFLAEAPSKIKTTQKATSMTLEVVERNASRLSGKAINVLMQENDENAELVIAKLRRDGIPKRLQPYQDGLKQNAKPDENT